MKNLDIQRGALPLIILIIAAIVIVGGGILFFTAGPKEPSAPEEGITEEPMPTLPTGRQAPCATTQILCIPGFKAECINDNLVCVEIEAEAKATTTVKTPAPAPAAPAPKQQTTTSGSGAVTATTTAPTATTTPATTTEQVETAPPAPKENLITYSDTGFSPKILTIKISDGDRTVKFINQGTIYMWVAADPHPTHWSYYDFDQRTGVSKYGTWQFTFPANPRTLNYHNHFSPSHTATIIIE